MRIEPLHLLGLELGMFVERKETGQPGQFDGLSIAAKRARALHIATELGFWAKDDSGQLRLGAPALLPKPEQQQ